MWGSFWGVVINHGNSAHTGFSASDPEMFVISTILIQKEIDTKSFEIKLTWGVDKFGMFKNIHGKEHENGKWQRMLKERRVIYS